MIGPIALDVKQSFEDRWSKESGDVNHVGKSSFMTNLIDTLKDSDDSEDTETDTESKHVCKFDKKGHEDCEDKDGSWTIQLFRSITADSCKMESNRKSILHSVGGSQVGQMVEKSIHDCMVREIRRAKRFIYLENQYFLGSSQDWHKDSNNKCQNLIPIELTKKIVEKICFGEPFKVYIIIPMFPEGDPSSMASQEILYWQYRTMEFMYKRIAQAINVSGNGSQPNDYLAFFCLGKRESNDETVWSKLNKPRPGTIEEKLRQTQRQPIYVHSKMSIFDDEYILVGSANINERSLAGDRDTEIAVGGYEPRHICRFGKMGHILRHRQNPKEEDHTEGNSKGAVHTFRMALWSSHFGGYNEVFLNPESDECLKMVRKLSQNFQKLYIQDEPEHSDCHAMPYPIEIDEKGNITPAKSWTCFPDTTCPVFGQRSSILGMGTQKLTT